MKQKNTEPDIRDLVHSSLRDLEVFEESVIWRDMKAILEDWENGLKGNYDEAETLEDVKKLQGISECIRYVKNLPEAMKAIISEEVENES